MYIYCGGIHQVPVHIPVEITELLNNYTLKDAFSQGYTERWYASLSENFSSIKYFTNKILTDLAALTYANKGFRS